jgi:hypothetical protein
MRDTSKYVLHGVRIPSVTEVLDIAGLIDWSMVPPGVLEEAGERGHRVHEWLELLDQGFLDLEDEPDEDIAGFVGAYLRFKDETGFKPELIEHVVVNETYAYAGMLDRTGRLNGDRAMVDLKTVRQVNATTALQTAGYAACLGNGHRRFALQLRPDGTYSLVPYTDRNDVHDFYAAVRLAHWRIKHQGVRLP